MNKSKQSGGGKEGRRKGKIEEETEERMRQRGSAGLNYVEGNKQSGNHKIMIRFKIVKVSALTDIGAAKMSLSMLMFPESYSISGRIFVSLSSHGCTRSGITGHSAFVLSIWLSIPDMQVGGGEGKRDRSHLANAREEVLAVPGR